MLSCADPRFTDSGCTALGSAEPATYPVVCVTMAAQLGTATWTCCASCCCQCGMVHLIADDAGRILQWPITPPVSHIQRCCATPGSPDVQWVCTCRCHNVHDAHTMSFERTCLHLTNAGGCVHMLIECKHDTMRATYCATCRRRRTYQPQLQAVHVDLSSTV